MIRREGEYYICEDDEPIQPIAPADQPADRQYSEVGDIKERLALIKQRVITLKQQKAAAVSVQPISLASLQGGVELSDYAVRLQVPRELLQLEERIGKLEEQVFSREVQRQGVERAGTIVERVKRLQRKLEEMIKNKSIEIINQSINQYSSNLDEKEENFKHLFLYDVFNKTQGLTAQIDLLEKYLSALGRVQRSLNSLVPLPTLVGTHNALISKQQQLAPAIYKLMEGMRQDYQQLLLEIEAIE